MRFWDSSAIVPLIVSEIATPRVLPFAAEPEPMYVWWSTRLEIAAALARRERTDAGRDADKWSRCFAVLHDMTEDWREIAPSDPVRRMAERLVRRHDFRAADSLHLGAALIACDDSPAGHEFACFDARLRRAAAAEGFRLLPP